MYNVHPLDFQSAELKPWRENIDDEAAYATWKRLINLLSFQETGKEKDHW